MQTVEIINDKCIIKHTDICKEQNNKIGIIQENNESIIRENSKIHIIQENNERGDKSINETSCIREQEKNKEENSEKIQNKVICKTTSDRTTSDRTTSDSDTSRHSYEKSLWNVSLFKEKKNRVKFEGYKTMQLNDRNDHVREKPRRKTGVEYIRTQCLTKQFKCRKCGHRYVEECIYCKRDPVLVVMFSKKGDR